MKQTTNAQTTIYLEADGEIRVAISPERKAKLISGNEYVMPSSAHVEMQGAATIFSTDPRALEQLGLALLSAAKRLEETKAPKDQAIAATSHQG